MSGLADALQHALAVEHQVVYGYGIVGAHVGDRAGNATIRSHTLTPDQALQRLEEHEKLRDRISSLLLRLHQRPAPAAVAYALPFPVTDAVAARKLAQSLEQSVAGAAYDVIAVSGTGSAERTLMVGSLAAAADWGGRWALAALEPFVEAFPGQPGQSEESGQPSQPSTTPTSSSS